MDGVAVGHTQHGGGPAFAQAQEQCGEGRLLRGLLVEPPLAGTGGSRVSLAGLGRPTSQVEDEVGHRVLLPGSGRHAPPVSSGLPSIRGPAHGGDNRQAPPSGARVGVGPR